MAILTGDFTSGLYTRFQVVWENAFFAAEFIANYPRFTETIESQTAEESYNWLTEPPAMREWIGPRLLQDMPAMNYTLVNREWEGTIEVKRTALEDDRYSAIRIRVAQLGEEAARFIGYQVSQALINGHTTACYDGSNFFDTTHSEGSSGTQSNYLTGSGGDTLAHVRADFLTARTDMRRAKDAQGRPVNLLPDLIIAPPDLQDLFEQLLNTNFYPAVFGSNTAAAAPSNNLYGAADVIIDANLTDTNDWFLGCTKSVVKPLIYQHRLGPEFDALDNPSVHERVFMRGSLAYGVRARFAIGYSFWKLMYQISNS